VINTMDKPTVMHAFCGIVERGSSARAAEDRHGSAGLLSREIEQQERSLGCNRLTRTTRSMSRTEQGRNHHDDTRRIRGAGHSMEARVRRGSGDVDADEAPASNRLRAAAGPDRGRSVRARNCCCCSHAD
jgi:DNA-binding transcriptional LysR family regulator